MKLSVDQGLCLASALCTGFAPEILALDEEGELAVLDENPPPETHEDIRLAVSSCPVHALSFKED